MFLLNEFVVTIIGVHTYFYFDSRYILSFRDPRVELYPENLKEVVSVKLDSKCKTNWINGFDVITLCLSFLYILLISNECLKVMVWTPRFAKQEISHCDSHEGASENERIKEENQHHYCPLRDESERLNNGEQMELNHETIITKDKREPENKNNKRKRKRKKNRERKPVQCESRVEKADRETIKVSSLDKNVRQAPGVEKASREAKKVSNLDRNIRQAPGVEKADYQGTQCSIEKQHSHPKALPNMGLTCYLNVILQCFHWTPKFCQVLESEVNKHDSCQIPLSRKLLKIMSLLNMDSDSNMKRKALIEFLHEVQLKNNQFAGDTQEDAFELFNTIISGIEDEITEAEVVMENKYSQNVAEEAVTINMETVSTVVAIKPDKRETSSDDKRNILSALFEGSFKTVYTYESCSHSQEVCQKFTSLCLPANKSTTSYENGNMTDVEMSLKKLFGEQKFPERELFCQSIHNETTKTSIRKKKNNSEKMCSTKMLMIICPPVLVLQINRFVQIGRSVQKIQKGITFPDILDLSDLDVCCPRSTDKILDNATRRVSYSLYAVVCHRGTVAGGHYYAYVKTTKYTDPGIANNTEGKEWYYVSDESVRKEKSFTVFDNTAAYLLYYERV